MQRTIPRIECGAGFPLFPMAAASPTHLDGNPWLNSFQSKITSKRAGENRKTQHNLINGHTSMVFRSGSVSSDFNHRLGLRAHFLGRKWGLRERMSDKSLLPKQSERDNHCS